MTRGNWAVSVVGATGLVGSEIVRQLLKRRFPMAALNLFASPASPTQEVYLKGRWVKIRPFSLNAIRDSEICFLAAGGEFSRRYARRIASLGNIVIDNSSAFRMNSDVPLVVPEINPEDLSWHRGLIANPNCSTIQMVVVLAPLHRKYKLRKVVVSTYQSVSGAGTRAVAELASQADAILNGQAPRGAVFPHQIGFNVIPHIDTFDSEGWSREESKMLNETRKILKDKEIDVIATTVRVPVFRGHSEAVYAEFATKIDVDEVRRELGHAPGVVVMDDVDRSIYPTPAFCAGEDATFVGRIRRVPGSNRALCMWIVSDNVLKGAALNAVQIAEQLMAGHVRSD